MQRIRTSDQMHGDFEAIHRIPLGSLLRNSETRAYPSADATRVNTVIEGTAR